MPYLANTYLVKPEQSNPPLLVPPREYLIPRHASAVRIRSLVALSVDPLEAA